MTLQGQVALVTGAAKGIGRGCALELARAGCYLALADLSGQEKALREVAREAGQYGAPGVAAFTANVFKRQDCATLVEDVRRHFPRIEILVSNPSWNRRGNFLDYDPEVFVATIHATLISAFYISQPVAREMVNSCMGGNIIFISSEQAGVSPSRSPAYNAGKRGLEAFAETIAGDLARDGVRVNVIRPGWIDTPLERAKYGSALETEGAGIPLGRLGMPEEIGQAVVAICQNRYITGANLLVDGGLSLKPHIEERRPLDETDNIDSPIPDFD